MTELVRCPVTVLYQTFHTNLCFAIYININPWNAVSFWTLKNHVFHIWQKTLTGSREMKNIVLRDESPMTLSEMP